jgi:Na+-driven multidrug efflux pump
LNAQRKPESKRTRRRVPWWVRIPNWGLLALTFAATVWVGIKLNGVWVTLTIYLVIVGALGWLIRSRIRQRRDSPHQ